MRLVATRLTEELGLALAVGSFAMTTLRTGLAGIRRVDELDHDPRQPRLVHDEGGQLCERPTSEPIPGITASGRNPCTDAFEVLKGNAAPGALGGLDDLLGDDVVLMPAEAGFLAGDPLQLLARTLGSLALQASALEPVLAANLLDTGAGVYRAVAVGREVGDPQIHSQEVLRL